MRKLGLVLSSATTTPVVPEPGIYPNIPMWEYQAWDAASNSRLTQLHRSAAHLKAYLDAPQPDKAHFTIGRATHSAILEPDDFAKVYVRSSDGCDRRTKAGKEEWAALEAEAGEGNVLKMAEYEMVTGMREAVLKHPKAAKLITGQGRSELSMVWIDPSSGVRCKARMDRHSPLIAGGAVVDIKTTRDARREKFERAVYEHGYHRQAAMYLAGAKILGLAAESFVVIAVEKETPYVTAIYRLTEGAIDAGEEQLFGKTDEEGEFHGGLLAKYAECHASNDWPGYSDLVQDIALPNYAWGQIDDEIKETA